MRILQVRFKNLNSLVGEWQIDLMHPGGLAGSGQLVQDGCVDFGFNGDSHDQVTLDLTLTSQAVPLGNIVGTEPFRNAALDASALDHDPALATYTRAAAGGVDMDSGFHGGANEVLAIPHDHLAVIRLKDDLVLMLVHQAHPFRWGFEL